MTRTCRFLVLLLAVLLGLARPVQAATGTLFPAPWFYALDTNGNPISLAKACFYTAGTSTLATTYSDVALGTPNANPVRADTAGRVGPVYLTPGQSYKLILQDSTGTAGTCDGAVVRTQDNIGAVPTSSGVVDVTGTAGEALTAGQAVYLSDGSGGKTLGSWYKADSANTYSSTTNYVGLATVTIGSGNTGAIRIGGSVTGLTVTAGTKYYVGTAGALTSTAPTNARLLGQADTATSIVLQGNPTPFTGGTLGQVVTAQGTGVPPTFQAQGFFDDFRLSLTTAVPVTTTDVTAATTLYLTPYTGNRITLFDSSGNSETCSTAEISIAIPASTSQLYDVWAYDSGTFGACTVALELLAWTNDSTRATAISRTNGRYVKSGTVTRLYVGSVRTTTVSGQTEDSLLKRYVWNYYNRRPRALQLAVGAGTYNYTTATVRQFNASTANQVAAIVGVAEDPIQLGVIYNAYSAAAAAIVQVGIGADVTNAFSTGNWGGFTTITSGGSTTPLPLYATYQAIPAAGAHVYAACEWSNASGATTTWNSATGATSPLPNGIQGWIQG